MPSLAAFFSTQLQGRDVQRLGQFVKDALGREGGERRARRPIGRGLGPVDHHVIAHRLDVLQVVGRERRSCSQAPRESPDKAPAWKARVASAAVILPFLVAPILTVMTEPEVGPVPRNTSSRDITIFTGRPVLRDMSTAKGSR